MTQSIRQFIFSFFLFAAINAAEQSNRIVLKDIQWDKTNPAGSTELIIHSANSQLEGMIYRPNGNQKHPTLIFFTVFPETRENSILHKL